MVEQESQEDSVDQSVSVTRHKIIFVGDAGVGKTSIVGRIMDNPFKETYETSIGVDFCSKNIRYKGLSTKLQIWDSAGQERYKSLIPSYIRNSSIVFLVYDVSKKQTFKNIPEWISFIKKIEDSIIVLIGNKIDLPNRYNYNIFFLDKFQLMKEKNMQKMKEFHFLKLVQRQRKIFLKCFILVLLNYKLLKELIKKF